MAEVGVLGPTAEPFNPPCNCFLAAQKQNSHSFLVHHPHPCFLWLFRMSQVVRQAATGGGDQLLACSQLCLQRPLLQPSSSWSARFPDPPRSPPATTHLPGKVRVRARLWKRLVVQSGCVGWDSGNIWLDETIIQLLGLPLGSFLQDL